MSTFIPTCTEKDVSIILLLCDCIKNSPLIMIFSYVTAQQFKIMIATWGTSFIEIRNVDKKCDS